MVPLLALITDFSGSCFIADGAKIPLSRLPSTNICSLTTSCNRVKIFWRTVLKASSSLVNSSVAFCNEVWEMRKACQHHVQRNAFPVYRAYSVLYKCPLVPSRFPTRETVCWICFNINPPSLTLKADLIEQGKAKRLSLTEVTPFQSVIYRIVHEESVIQLKGVMRGVVDQIQEWLVALGVYRRALRAHAAQYPANSMRDELGTGGMLVMLFAGHLHHATALILEELHNSCFDEPFLYCALRRTSWKGKQDRDKARRKFKRECWIYSWDNIMRWILLCTNIRELTKEIAIASCHQAVYAHLAFSKAALNLRICCTLLQSRALLKSRVLSYFLLSIFSDNLSPFGQIRQSPSQ